MASAWHAMGPFTVFDVETTGMSPVRDRIVEIGAVRVDRDGVWTRFETLVNPGMPIPYQVTRVHGIDDRMVAGAPSFSDAAYRFLDFARGSKLVAHNARFDLSFLQESLARVGLPLWKTGAYDSIVSGARARPGDRRGAPAPCRIRCGTHDGGVFDGDENASRTRGRVNSRPKYGYDADGRTGMDF